MPRQALPWKHGGALLEAVMDKKLRYYLGLDDPMSCASLIVSGLIIAVMVGVMIGARLWLH